MASLAETQRLLDRRSRERQHEHMEQVAAMNAVLNELHAHQSHICKQHPVSEEQARAWCPDADPERISEAVFVASNQPHDVFEGLV